VVLAISLFIIYCLLQPHTPQSTLFPYTTLFRSEKAEAIAKTLGISSIMNKRTYEISGGQAQRAAIARAMIHKPKLLLADEPTGNLDSKSSKDVMERKSTRLNSSHVSISYAVFCLKKKEENTYELK